MYISDMSSVCPLSPPDLTGAAAGFSGGPSENSCGRLPNMPSVLLIFQVYSVLSTY